MNLFLVTSPFQLLCAIEAKHQYGTKDNILILREEKSHQSIQQNKLILDKDDWDHILYLGRKSKVWEACKLQSKLKKINHNLHFDNMFYADYSAWRTSVILNNISVEHEVMIDDGVGTVREFNEKINPRLVVSRNKKSRDLLLRMVGLKPPRKIYPRDNFSFFTFFDLPKSKQKIKKNNFNELKKKLNTKACYNPNGDIGFIGQGLVAEKGINLDYYVNMLESLIQENDRDIIYFPHRTEANFVKARLKQVKRLQYHQSEYPLELEIAVKQLSLSKIYGIASTATITLEKLYLALPVIDLQVPLKHYLIEEFGQSFFDVAHALNLQSIELN